MERLRLDDEQRQQLYSVARREWDSDRGTDLGRIRRVKARVRSQLLTIGWEVILINIAIQFLLPILVRWLESLIKSPEFEPEASMPVFFAVPGADVEDED